MFFIQDFEVDFPCKVSLANPELSKSWIQEKYWKLSAMLSHAIAQTEYLPSNA